MQYVAKILDNFKDLNTFQSVDEYSLMRNNETNLYFRLYTQLSDCNGNTSLTRYIPTGTSNYVEVKFNHLDADLEICRGASLVSTDDKSIWMLPILDSDEIATNSMSITLYEDSKKTNFIVQTSIISEETSLEKDWFI